MSVEQEFPVSIEAQFLGGNGTESRTTANICTPGTNMVIEGELITRHCTNSTSPTFHGDQWVTVEMEIRGSDSLVHRINGEQVFSLTDIQLDDQDPDAQALLQDGAEFLIKEGYVALQAESHPTQFRRIELLPLGTE
jgi:5-deoxy-D-glucuronate isomerase